MGPTTTFRIRTILPLATVLGVGPMVACSDYQVLGEPIKEPKGEESGTPSPQPGDSGEDSGGDSGADGGDTGTVAPASCALETPPAIDVALNDSCYVPYSSDGFLPTVELQVVGFNGFGPATVVDLDDESGDGVYGGLGDNPELVYSANDGSGLLVFDGRTGALEWHNSAIVDATSGTAAGDLDGDGIPEIVATNGVNEVLAFSADGVQLWSATLDPGEVDWSAFPAIADLDADGQPEVIVGRTILNNGGGRVGNGAYGSGACKNEGSPYYQGGSIAVPVDLDGDGQQEVLVGNAAYHKNGSTLWANGGPDGLPAVADMDMDGEPEIVLVSGDTAWTLETDGSPTGWSTEFSRINYLGPPAIDDLDGDGSPEMVLVGGREMRAYRWDGRLLWSVAVEDHSGAAGPVMFDFEGDGYPEVVFADEVSVRIFNGLDGSVKMEATDHASETGFETPVVADIDGDGEVEIVLLHGSGPNGLTVYGDVDHGWQHGRAVWNQHAFSITNVEEDGSIPTVPPPNWATHNNFRSAAGGLPPGAYNDLSIEIVEVCTEECPDNLVLSVRVWNQGTEYVPSGLELIVQAGHGGPVVSRATIPDGIASGRSSVGIVFSLASSDLGGLSPVVGLNERVAPLSGFDDCAPENNHLEIPTSCD